MTDYTSRPITIIEHKAEAVEVLHPQYTALASDNIATNGRRYLDFGSLCYRHRKKRSFKKNTIYAGVLVDIDSLEIDRISTISKLIELARSYKSFASSVGLYNEAKYFFDWIDNQAAKTSANIFQVSQEAYAGYTKHLLHRLNSATIRGESLSISSASRLQAVARQVVSYAIGVHEREIGALATLIIQNARHKHVNLKQLSEDTQSRTFATLVSFINEAHRILVTEEDFPMRLESPAGKLFYLHTLHQGSKKSKSAKISIVSLLDSSPTFPEWDMIKIKYCIPDTDGGEFFYKLNYEVTKRRHIESNTNKRSALRFQVANHAMTAGMMAFIAATGCNLSVAQSLDIRNCEVIPSTQGRRFYGIKSRAQGKTVTPEFGAQFTPIFKKIMDIREWLLEGSESHLLFSIRPKGTNSIGYVGTSALSTLRVVFRKYFPHIFWVSAVQWRKNVSYSYINKSGGDSALTAEKLNNTESSVSQAYARPALEEFAIQMSKLFDSIHAAAIARSRKIANIPVRIIQEKKIEEITGVGSCGKDADSQPRRSEGFTENSPAPSCRSPETCLFCAFYAVHADEEDIRRLLSLRYIITASKRDQEHEHWELKFGPSIHRIDEILSMIGDTNVTMPLMIDRVKGQVNSGDLDPFWAIHFDTMVYVGVVV